MHRTGKLKKLGLRLLLRFSRLFMQSRWWASGKAAVWKHVCVPYFCWRDDDYLCTTRFGRRMHAQPTQFIENRILFFGVWEPNVTFWFERLVQPGDVVLDVGANVGYYTLLASKLVGPAGRVYAVEASPSIRRRLANNLELNPASNVTVLPYAAWNRRGQADLHLGSVDRGNSSLHTLVEHDTAERVELVRLEDVIPAEVAPRLRLIKLDVEGAEYHALDGLRRLVEISPRVTILAEVTPAMLCELGSSPGALLDLLARMGFRAYEIANRYEVEAYLAPTTSARPAPLTGVPEEPTEIVFSREELGGDDR